MRGWAALPIVIAVLLLAISAASADEPYRAQKVRRGGYAKRPEYMSGTMWKTSAGRSFNGMRTRVDALKLMDEMTNRALERYDSKLPVSPLRRFLDRRNLMSARSPLGRRLTSSLGFRTTDIPDENDNLDVSGDFLNLPSTIATPTSIPSDAESFGQIRTPPSYESILESRIKRMADEYYQKGLAYTSKFDASNRKLNTLLPARSYFDLCIDADPSNPRGYLANSIVSFRNNEAFQAYHYLLEGLKRVKTADDLKIDKTQFFTDPDAYRAIYDRATIFARSLDTNSEAAGNVMLAYYAYIYGDLGLATTSIDLAAKNPPKELTEVVLKFRDIIKNTSAATSAPAQDK